MNTTSLIKTYTGGRGKIKQILSYSDSEVVLLDFGGRILVYSLIKNKVKALNSDLKNISNGFIQEVNK